MVAVLHVRLLGDFGLVWDEQPVTGLNSARLQSLLVYLLLHRDAPQFRAYLAYQFWPNSTEAQARTNLRNLLHRLRRGLPNAGTFLTVDAQTMQWRPGAPFTLDVADFESALGRAEGAVESGDQATARDALGQAVALYRGDLLPSCYDDWILPERERLLQQHLGALERLIWLLEADREYDGAIRYARHLLRHDPLHEEAYRRLMCLHAAKGDRAGALRAYYTCATALQRELGVEPSLATRKVYEQLLAVEARPAPTSRISPGVLPLVGREEEWVQLQAAWRKAERGPRFVLLIGEAGIGKTRLVEELLDWGARQGLERAYARCCAAEGELAYAPVTALLRDRPLPPLDDAWLSEVARLLPEVLVERPDLSQPRPMIEAWQRQHLFEALARAVLGGGDPLLLAIDDLHWCDRETLKWLHFLLRFDPQARLLVVGTCRPEELDQDCPFSATLPALHRDVRLAEVELGPLDEDETASVAANVAGGALDPGVADLIYRETEGNPLFLVEMVRAGLEGGSWKLEIGDGHARSAVQPPTTHLQSLPPRVQAVLAGRLAQLSTPARELAGLAATIGRAFTFSLLRAAGDSDEAALVDGLDELWQRRIVRERGAEAYDFTHDKLREAAYGALSPARRRWLHGRVAKGLETIHGSDLDLISRQLAGHYRHAGLPGKAIPNYLRAGQVASRLYANGEAETCFRRGLALLKEGAWDTTQEAWCGKMAAGLYEGLGDVLRLTGHHEEARAAFESAFGKVEAGTRLHQSRLFVKIGFTWWGEGQYDRALQSYTQAESILGAEPVEAESAWWRQWLDIQQGRLHVYYFLARFQETAELAARAQPALQRYGTPVQRAWFIGTAVSTAMRRDRYVISDEMLDLARAAKAASQQAGDPFLLALIQLIIGWCYLLRGEPYHAEKELQATLALTERTGDVHNRVYALTWLTFVRRRDGQVDAVREYAARTLAAATAAYMPEQLAAAQANLAWIAWREGNLTEAEGLGNAALQAWRSSQWVYAFQWTALWPLLAVALAQDQAPEALGHARALLDPQQQRLPRALESALQEVIEAGERDREEACSHLQRAVELARETGYL